jgi:hypothetical protein
MEPVSLLEIAAEYDEFRFRKGRIADSDLSGVSPA